MFMLRSAVVSRYSHQLTLSNWCWLRSFLKLFMFLKTVYVPHWCITLSWVWLLNHRPVMLAWMHQPSAMVAVWRPFFFPSSYISSCASGNRSVVHQLGGGWFDRYEWVTHCKALCRTKVRLKGWLGFLSLHFPTFKNSKCVSFSQTQQSAVKIKWQQRNSTMWLINPSPTELNQTLDKLNVIFHKNDSLIISADISESALYQSTWSASIMKYGRNLANNHYINALI